MTKSPILPLLFSLGTPVAAQELLSNHASSSDFYAGVFSFGDLDHDGYDDVFGSYYTNYTTTAARNWLRIQSGRDGSLLDTRLAPSGWRTLLGVGDFDVDGYPDYAIVWDTGFFNTQHVQIWSPHTDLELLRVSGSRSAQFGGVLAGGVDLNADGLPDLVVGSTYPPASDIRAFDHSGAQIYRVQAWPLGMTVLSLLGLDDIDGDGCSEILVGGADYNLGYTRGFLAVLSGRTGTVLRLRFDEQRGDLQGFPIAPAGDVDLDGIEDYAAGNFWGGGLRSVLTVFSGATGATIRQWTEHRGSSPIVGSRDIDLDGVPDILSGVDVAGAKLQALSSRDGQWLFRMEPVDPFYGGSFPLNLADLGVQPGSPYPVFAFTYSGVGSTRKHFEIWRASPPGTSILGTGCSSLGNAPTAGVRPVESPSGDQSRLVLGSAPPGALAWCLAAAQGSNDLGGISLPIPLDPLGFPGCNLYVPPTLFDTRLVGTAGFDRGYAGIDLPLQLASTGGFAAAVQWLVLDLAAGSFAATPRLELRVQ